MECIASIEKQKEAVKNLKSQLIEFYKKNYETTSKEKILDTLFKFQQAYGITTICKNDYEDLKFALVKVDVSECRNKFLARY